MYFFVVNRVSGNGKGGRVWQKVERELQLELAVYEVVFTESDGHALQLVRERVLQGRNLSAVIAIGGDGTVQEVANGLVGSDIALGLIAAGSGNDFARSLHIPLGYKQAWQRIKRGQKKRIDLLRVGERACLTVVGAGFDGMIAKVTNASLAKKWLSPLKLGGLAYMLSLIKVLIRYQPTQMIFTIDGEVHTLDDVWLLTTANMPYCGGGMMICPDADCEDGVVDVCVVHGVTRLKLLLLFPKVFKGSHVSHWAVKMYRGRRIDLQSSQAVWIHGDGESLGQTPLQVEVLEQAVFVV